MRTRSKLLIPAAMAAFFSTALAQSPTKIGFVNFTAALQATAEVKKELQSVRDFIEGKNQENDSLLQEITTLRDDLNAKLRTLNPDTVAQMQREIEDKETQLQRFQEDTQREINQRRDAVLRKYGQKLQELVTEFGKQNGYMAIFLLDQAQFGYVSPEIDLTANMIALYDQRYPAAGAGTPSPPPQ